VAGLGKLVVKTDVDEAYATQIKPDLTAVLQRKGGIAKRNGRIDFVASQVDTATGGLAVKYPFDDPVWAAIGLSVPANIVVERKAAAITVPVSAVDRDKIGTAVFGVVADHALRRPATVID
jgi:multidrug efflux pump subunit AcrA (membrane-fusion protein)